MQKEADLSTKWVRDNCLVCSPDKTKLLVMSPPGQQLRQPGELLTVNVCGMVVTETTEEKLLGIGISSNMTWHKYLFGITGNKDFPGLVKKLSQRVGMLQQVAKLLPRDKLKLITNGIFFSKLIYCLQVFGNCWGINGIGDMDENDRRSVSFTKHHCNILQILENKVLRLLTGHGYDVSIKQLLEESGQMSVQQLVCYHTLLTIFKVVRTGEPRYLAGRLGVDQIVQERGRTGRRQHDIRLNYELSISRAGTLYRGKILWNSLPVTIRTVTTISRFKRMVKEWVKNNISIRPT